MNIVDLKFVPQDTPDLNIQAFDCGRKSVNDFFYNEAQDYQDELFGKTTISACLIARPTS